MFLWESHEGTGEQNLHVKVCIHFREPSSFLPLFFSIIFLDLIYFTSICPHPLDRSQTSNIFMFEKLKLNLHERYEKEKS